jgi:hypothetical protein
MPKTELTRPPNKAKGTEPNRNTSACADSREEDFDLNATNTAKRISVSLSADAAQMLEYLAKTQGITQNEALRKAIATEAYFHKEIRAGSKVLLQKSDKEIREVVFR